ncbi:3-hydroxyacyl-CoA dehydrogenase [Pseudorhodoferax sp.]|uniref:3-hydroxyacyl-CoA dehydrogenase n=1 Tax=Pseudorhodoferax sp. TaxID=1993553 RepID=UPI002DD657BC|nr:3-hydroxyacyl-CoA dehydrogenase [Pseudorhodoferax sp.]
MTEPADRIDVVGVVGTGTMGVGIAQILAVAGVQVSLFDSRPGAAASACEAIAAALAALVAKGRLAMQERAAALSRLVVVDRLEAMAGAALVVEAIVEDLDAKHVLLRHLEAVLSPDAILATNTSSLSVTAVAAACERPSRVVGWHFFNPVPLLRVAEVIPGLQSAPSVVQAVMALTRRTGHLPLQAADMPGFIVNHAGRAFLPEALRLQAEAVATPQDIDRVLKDCAGFRMGPFALMDLVGLDVAQRVMDSLYRQYFHEPRFAASPLVELRVRAGLLGRKTGRGFYRYEAGAMVAEPEAQAATARSEQSFWICSEQGDLAARVRSVLLEAGATVEACAQPSADALLVLTPLGEDVSGACARLGLDAGRAVGVDALFGLDQRRVLMFAPGAGPTWRAAAAAWLGADGTPVTVLADSPGFIGQRMVAQIINVGCDIAQRGIAAPTDIDLAVERALGYPMGPFAWGDHIGPARVLQITQALFAATGEPRYRPSTWLRRRAQLGLPLGTPS